MSTTTAQQRRGKSSTAKSEATSTTTVESNELLLRPAASSLASSSTVAGANHTNIPHVSTAAPPTIAMVRRRFCGTGPFDKHWLNLDCCGLFCALLTYCLLLYGIYAVCFVLIPPWMSYHVDISNESVSNNPIQVQLEQQQRYLTPWGHLHRTIFTAVAVLAMVAHFKAMTTDPGAVPPDARPILDEIDAESQKQQLLEPSATFGNSRLPPQALRLCRRCKAFKPQRAHHCSVCRRCIIKLDHHCPWINNCCAVGNHKYFLLFIFYTFVSCVYSLSLVLVRFATCIGFHHHHHARSRLEFQQQQRLNAMQHETCLDRPSDLLSILGLMVESLLFGMFTSCMMCDQAHVVNTRLTHIDRLQGLELSGTVSGWTEVFGVSPFRGKKKDLDPASASSSLATAQSAKFRIDWLLPWGRVCWDGIETEIMGFCRPATTSLSSSTLADNYLGRSGESELSSAAAAAPGRVLNVSGHETA